jgi:hypothetical protein
MEWIGTVEFSALARSDVSRTIRLPIEVAPSTLLPPIS